MKKYFDFFKRNLIAEIFRPSNLLPRVHWSRVYGIIKKNFFYFYNNNLKLKAKYREFLKLTKYSTSKPGSPAKQNEQKQACQIIVQLIDATNLVPMKYRRLLIMDVLPLLKEGLFAEEQIFSVLRSIQNYENRLEYLEKDTNLSAPNKKQPQHMDDTDSDDYFENFDGQKWQELLVELSDKLADNFSLKSIEIATN